MKNLYFLAAVAAFVLGSCTVKEALDPPADPDDEAKAIGFGTFLDRVPQNGIKPLARVMDLDGPYGLKSRPSGFMVEAYKHAQTDWTDDARTATDYMSAQVTWSGSIPTPGSWTYSPTKYWPGDKVSFFAYLPTLNSMVVNFIPAEAAGKNPRLYCTMPTIYSAQIDFIVDAEYNLTGESDKVTFKFDHVLSRIGFKAQIPESYAPATVTMSGMTFTYNGLKISGTYTFNSGTYTGSNKDPGNWSVADDGQPGVLINNLLAPSGTLSSITLSTTPYDISEAYNPTRYLMLIPQENPDKTAYVEVAYTIDYPDGSGHPDVIVPSVATPDNRVYLPKTTWKPGIAYTYTLNIAGPRAVKIDVEEAKWNDWEDGGDVPIDIP